MMKIFCLKINYTKIVLSEVPDILDYYKCYPDESKELRRRTENIPLSKIYGAAPSTQVTRVSFNL